MTATGTIRRHPDGWALFAGDHLVASASLTDGLLNLARTLELTVDPRWRLEDGRYLRPYPPAIAEVIDAWDGGDPFGSAMSVGWAIAQVADAADVPAACAVLEYHPGAGGSYTLDELADYDGDGSDADIPIESNTLAEAYRAGRVTDDDLVLGARVISRYIDLCRLAGRDY